MPDEFVVVVQRGQLWVVSVTENGTNHEATYELQSSAENFAAGQRLRLGMPPKPSAS